ncbi:MAG: tRNA (adenosine(37)-N6)-threonylcarbamoyltransferase complex ATPase subunit type 1 TsaE [Chlorobi bacterium]|nr:tRNA (adenosine(37)-N6)-threonylcarbamoyltransferase complex ATPase subunit type 1 TsaE [Chlorobiota bacterium]
MEKKLISTSVDDLHVISEKILSELENERIFALYGKMGAGKTTLIKEFCQVLGVDEVVSSPTFAIVNEYTGRDSHSVFHFDFYRIKKIEEVFDIGYEEYVYGGHYCFIEWPELIDNLLPESFVRIDIEVEADDRRVIAYRREVR